MKNIDEQNDHLKAAWHQLNAHAGVGRNSRPSSYLAAVSASGDDACVQSTDDQTSD